MAGPKAKPPRKNASGEGGVSLAAAKAGCGASPSRARDQALRLALPLAFVTEAVAAA
jgi:hypothetical protein